MEVVAVGLDYDNETATVRVSVFASIPTTNESQYLNISKNFLLAENFTYYEIYLMALHESEDDFPHPPPDCLTDSFLQHSRREVFVDGCPLSNEPNKSSKLEFPAITVNSPVPPFWETSCVNENTVILLLVIQQISVAHLLNRPYLIHY